MTTATSILAAPGPSPPTTPIPSLAALAAERDAIRLAVLTAPTWRLQTRWLGRQWARLLAIEAEMGRREPPRPGWP